MKKEIYNFEVNEKNFDETVIHNSHTLPVFVEFMGFWSEPCVTMSEVVSDLAAEFAGQFIFAKVDIDEHTELRKKFKIENIPCLKIFVNGEIVTTEEGQLTEDECRDLLKQYNIFHESDEMRLQARELHLSGDTQAAFILLTDAIKKDPQNTRIALDMIQIFLDSNLIDNANGLFNKLPSSVKDSRIGQSLARQLAFTNQAAKTDGLPTLIQRIEDQPDDLDARFDLSVCQIAAYESISAIENLFYILERNLDYKDGAAKELVMVMINMLKEKEPDVAKETQQHLNNLLAA